MSYYILWCISYIPMSIQSCFAKERCIAFSSDDMRRNEGVPSTLSVACEQSDGHVSIRSPYRPHESSVMRWFTAGRQFEACPGKHGRHVHDACFLGLTQIFGSATAVRHRGVVSHCSAIQSRPLGVGHGCGSNKLSKIQRTKVDQA
jgi:hypothetical protein